jgi:hypothetical protein
MVLAGNGDGGRVLAGNGDGGRVLAKPHAGFGCGGMHLSARRHVPPPVGGLF